MYLCENFNYLISRLKNFYFELLSTYIKTTLMKMYFNFMPYKHKILCILNSNFKIGLEVILETYYYL